MADKKSIDELDEEMAELEEEIRRLEEGDVLEDETEPEAGSKGSFKDRLPLLGSKETEDAVEEEPPDLDEEEPARSEGALGKLLGRFSKEEAEDDDETETEDDESLEQPSQADDDDAVATDDEEALEAEQGDEESSGRFSKLMGRFSRGDEDEDGEDEAPDVDEPTPEAEDDAGDEDEEPVQAAVDRELEADLATPEPEQGTADATVDADEERRRDRSSLWERTPSGTWRRRDDAEVEGLQAEQAAIEDAPEDDEDQEDISRAASLLARFRSGSDDEEDAEDEAAVATTVPPDPEEVEEEEEEEEGHSKLAVLVWLLLGVVAIALIIALAATLFGGGGGDAPTAAVTASGITTEEGAFVALAGQAFTFNAGETTGTVDTYTWDFGDGSTETTEAPMVSYTYSSRGSFTVTVTAEGPDGSSQASLQVVAIQAPAAQAEVLVNGTAAPAPGEVGNNVFVGRTVTLDASASSADPDQPLAGYSWDTNGDGTEDATGETAEVSFDQAGLFVVNLTVTDALGHTASTSIPITVSSETLFSDTVGMSTVAQPATNEHPLPIPEGRAGSLPFQIDAVLTYTNPSQGVDADLDLTLIDPNGEFFNASDDDGQTGEETLTLTGSDAGTTGDWTVRITNDAMSIGGVNEVDYEVVIQVHYGQPGS